MASIEALETTAPTTAAEAEALAKAGFKYLKAAKQELERMLRTSLDRGLSSEEAQLRQTLQ